MFLLLRSLLWVILLPGMMAGYIPWRYFGLSRVRIDPSDPGHLLGVFLMAVGAGLLAVCIWDFARSGRGTLSPVDPPRKLVMHGLYRYVRNPMYLSVLTLVLGEWLLVRSTGLLIWWICFFVAASLFVIFYEEPGLRRKFGAEYQEYTRKVGRWLPRFR